MPGWAIALVAVVAVALIAAVALLADQVRTDRDRTALLDDRVAALESQVRSLSPEFPAVQPLPGTPEVTPADAEAARRSIDEAVRSVFSAGPPVEQRVAWVTGSANPGALFAPLLEAFSKPSCAGAVPVVTAVGFTSDGTATASFRVDGTTVKAAAGNTLGAELVRGPERWQVTAESVQNLARLAAPYC
ncbi:MAG: hypothetical protein ACOYOP_12305 [Microthrixaceae bacterium]